MQRLAADGIKVAKNGYVVVTSGYAVDVFDRYRTVIMRVVTNFTVTNMAFAGRDYKQLWVMGVGGIARVTTDWEGQY